MVLHTNSALYVGYHAVIGYSKCRRYIIPIMARTVVTDHSSRSETGLPYIPTGFHPVVLFFDNVCLFFIEKSHPTKQAEAEKIIRSKLWNSGPCKLVRGVGGARQIIIVAFVSQ